MTKVNKHLNGAVIGLGKMGLLHTAIANSSDNASIIAVCENVGLTSKAVSSFNSNIKMYSDYNVMLQNEKLDFVFIATPSDLHIDIAMECAKNKIPFFVEKPLCKDYKQGTILLNQLKKNPVINMVGFMKRYLNTYKIVKDLIQNDTLGKIFSCNTDVYVSQLFKKGKGWRYKKDNSGGGAFITIAIHALDLIFWYFGTPNRISANTISYYSKEVEDFGSSIMVYDSQMICTLNTSWSVHNHRLLDTKIAINGEYGRVVVNEDTVKIFLKENRSGYKAGWTTFNNPDTYEGGQLDIGGYHYSKQDESFLKAIIDGKVIESDVENAMKVHQMLDCIYLSSERQGELVHL